MKCRGYGGTVGVETLYRGRTITRLNNKLLVCRNPLQGQFGGQA